jgi:hypothetical protein
MVLTSGCQALCAGQKRACTGRAALLSGCQGLARLGRAGLSGRQRLVWPGPIAREQRQRAHVRTQPSKTQLLGLAARVYLFVSVPFILEES